MASTAIPIVPRTPPLNIGSLPFVSTTTTTTPARPPPSPSPSPSQAQAHLYSPTKPPRTQPNAHPYAIKTTSTALLSRSTSNATNTQSTAHHYVPSSPSPSPSMSPSPSPTSPTRDARDREFQPRATRHRYSRSLTSDMPMPLPPAPGTQTQKSYAIAPSHSTPGLANPYAYTYAQSQTANEHQSSHRRASLSAGSSAENDGDGDDDDDTPRKKNRMHQDQRAETMPLPLPSLPLHNSSSSSFDGLPDDPKTWTSAQLAVYVGLDGTANSGLMTKFVREKNLSGRAFLRLAETDLDSLPHAIRASLLALSRGLRHKLVRAKIFGTNSNGASHINQDDDDPNFAQNNPNNDEDKHAPISSLTRQHVIRPRRRSRVGSLSGASDSSVSSLSSDLAEGDTPRTNARRRVRERVDALEEKIGMMEEEGTASSSSASGLSSSAPTGAGGGEGEGVNVTGAGKIGTKKSRMPQRGAVASLFDQGPSTNSSSTNNPHNNHLHVAVEGNGKDTTTESAPANANGGVREVEDKDSTITHVARRNVNGREARMLPFPPVFPSVHHQQPGIPLPATHEHLQSQPHHHQHHQPFQGMSSPGPGAADSPSVSDEYYGYEFGLRRAFGSAPAPGHPRATNGEDDDPHAGVYVVRHHPSSPRIISGSHPGLGAGGVVSAHNTGGSGGGGQTGRKASPRLLPYPPVVGRAVLHHPRPRRLVGVGMGSETTATASDTGNEVWESALEDFGDGGGGREKEEEEEELSVQELLLREAEAASPEKKKRMGTGGVPISGVDAWEMELGDTVKRVGDVREKKMMDGNVEGGGGAGGGSVEIMRLFESASAAGDQEDPTQTRVDEIGLREDAVRVREDEVKAREEGVRVREEGVRTLDEILKAKEEAVYLREEDVRMREEGVKTKEDSVRNREEDMLVREESVDARLREVEARERAVISREEEVGRREVDVLQSEEGVGKREEAMQQWEKKREMLTEDESTQTVHPPSTEDKAIDTSNVASNTDAASQTEDGDIDDINVNGPRTTTTTTGQQPYLVSAWTIKRDWFLGRFRGIFAGARLGVVGVGPNTGAGVGSALVLMSLGLCAVVLRVLARKVLGGAAAHAAAGAGRR